MNDRRIPAILFFVLCLGAVGAFHYNKQPKPAPQPQAAAPVDDWVTYEDETITFKHPPEWTVDVSTKGNKHTWLIYQKLEDMHEHLHITSREENKTLQEVYDEYKAQEPESTQLNYERPQSIRVRHAECLKYKTHEILESLCRAEHGEYFQLLVMWTVNKNTGPIPKSYENAKKFDRILPTIKFK